MTKATKVTAELVNKVIATINWNTQSASEIRERLSFAVIALDLDERSKKGLND